MPARRDNSPFRTARTVQVRSAAFSLVEILVVIAIIGILLAVVFKGGGALVENARKRDTEALLKKLDLALDEYKREVDTSRIPFAKNIFNGAPPDDLRAFLGESVSIGGCNVQMRNTGSFPGFADPKDLFDARDGDGALVERDPAKWLYGDIRAMVLGIRLNAPKAKVILDSIDGKYWAEAGESFTFAPAPNAPTMRLDYLVDGWGRPLEYFSTCICNPNATLTPREHVSNAFVHENNDGPVVVSYGPNGAEQFATDMMAAEGDTGMVADYFLEMKDDPKNIRGLINHVFNSDNLYSSDFFTNRVRQTGP